MHDLADTSEMHFEMAGYCLLGIAALLHCLGDPAAKRLSRAKNFASCSWQRRSRCNKRDLTLWT